MPISMKWALPLYTARNPLHRALGVELEIAGFVKPKRVALEALYNTCVGWEASIGTDGSLSDPTGSSSSVEIRTAPASGDYFVQQITDITRAIRAANGVVNRSCGMHVHVDARDWYAKEYTIEVVKGVWTAIEPVMFSIVGPWRTQPSPHTGVAYCESNATARGRYAALNFQSLRVHNTIEFRLHHGCLNPRAIIGWATLCGAIIEWCVNFKFPQYPEEACHIVPMDFLKMVAPTKEAQALLNYAPRRWKRDKGHHIWQEAA